ncbi:hypothetical protein SEA_ROMAG_255 [Mycobacterium phage RoMag]|uniref:DNA-binding phage zinc finger domain-containing protein n=2 Tax=Bixzunavirus TaxID=680114 RepID=A0A411CCV7_9CAUD|nr:hypothetical protein M181_gp096 [Mycobacterium phage Gizmo]YP_010058092.1 hypothetical protein KHO62_gp094 [Mycobacterium phage NoodleTree]AOZ63109.1 hypothetical protein SEA_YUCCA_261 [Mycobacterium phage Yucca]AOZ63345.1 hypothetical protein SEA_ERDMANN_262 [Mycobacterium phage Erdmann]QAY08274.1 hypothetical protein SEA_KAMRYN_259 [Mycobacterium phage Kamryn]QAY26918.1 hypothetical protein SEA_ROMAG_255 [Mycobacterium phage RoMag]QPL13560.1 hypothetical protein SEA_STEPHANIEG_254 [Mycob
MADRWKGEWLVEVDEEGRVMLPNLYPGALRPTHYRISKPHYSQNHGELILVPMKVATAEDLRPEPPAPPESSEEPRTEPVDLGDRAFNPNYTLMEVQALRYPCPYCRVKAGEDCVASPSGRKLVDYEGTRNVHARRMDLAAEGSDTQ